MSTDLTQSKRRTKIGTYILWVGVVVLVIAMFLGTKVVSAGDTTADSGKFDAATFAEEKWSSEVLPAILDKATDLVTVADAIAEDPAVAATEYGVVEGSSAPVFSVSFTGVAGVLESGALPVTVKGLPKDVTVRVQMGPAINGTAVRDASGTISFPQFTNQIDYQDAATALNEKVKTEVLTGIDPATLDGKTVTMTGVFQLINPASYLITPVAIEVES